MIYFFEKEGQFRLPSLSSLAIDRSFLSSFFPGLLPRRSTPRQLLL